jgi:hypothetical protein
MTPTGCTHFAEFYTDIHFYKLSIGAHYNTVIDHPTECWQKYNIWHYWENEKWVSVGKGFSDRRCKNISEFAEWATE